MTQNPVRSRYTLNYILDDISTQDIYMFWWQQKKIEKPIDPHAQSLFTFSTTVLSPSGGWVRSLLTLLPFHHKVDSSRVYLS